MMSDQPQVLRHVVPDVTITTRTPPKHGNKCVVTSAFELEKLKAEASDVEDDDVFSAQSTLVLGDRYADRDDVMQRPLKPAIPLERIPSWRPEDETRAAHTNTFVLKSGHALHRNEPSPYNVPCTTVYNPSGTTGCFFNRHTLAHMLGLCRISKRFGKKCTHRKLSKKKRLELDYGFLAQRNHIKIYDFNRRLRHAVASGNNASHRERVLQILAKESNCHKEAGDVIVRPTRRNDVNIKGVFPDWSEVDDVTVTPERNDVSDEDALRRRAFSFDSSTSLRRGRARASQRAAASRQGNSSHAQTPETSSKQSSATSAFKRLARSFRLSKGEKRTHKHKVLSGTSRLGKTSLFFLDPFTLLPTSYLCVTENLGIANIRIRATQSQIRVVFQLSIGFWVNTRSLAISLFSGEECLTNRR